MKNVAMVMLILAGVGCQRTHAPCPIYRISGDGSSDILYVTDRFALSGKMLTENSVHPRHESMYSLVEAYWTGVPELSMLTGDTEQQIFVSNVESMWIPDGKDVIAGTGHLPHATGDEYAHANKYFLLRIFDKSVTFYDSFEGFTNANPNLVAKKTNFVDTKVFIARTLAVSNTAPAKSP